MLGQDLRACDSANNVDCLMSHYDSVVSKTIDHLADDPQSLVNILWGSIFNVDTMCEGVKSMEEKEKAPRYIVKRYQKKCVQCSLLSSISNTSVDDEFMIEYGSHTGMMLTLKRDHVSHPFHITIDHRLKDETQQLVDNENKLLECGTPNISNMTFLRCDEHTSHILISWLIDCALEQRRKITSAHVCGVNIYKLNRSTMTLDEAEKRYELSDQFVSSLIVQVVYILKRMSQYHYCHGNPSPFMLEVCDEQLSKEYDGIHLSSSFTLKLDPGMHSSINTSNTRICSTPKSLIKSTHITSMDSKWSVSKLTLYVPTKHTKEKRASGIPIYPCSLDLYCLLVGLACRDKYLNILEQLSWSKLWIGLGDYDIVKERIAKVDNPSHDQIMEILDGLWLRCDAVDLMWNNIKHMI